MSNILILLVCLVGLFFLSYILCGRDFFEPSTMLILTFMFSTLCAIYKYPLWQYEFSDKTTIVIISSLFLTLIIDCFVIKYSKRCAFKVIVSYSEKLSPIKFSMTILSLIIIMFTVIALTKHILRVGGGGASIQEIMASYRSNSSYSTNLDNQMPQWIKILQYFTNTFSYLYAFELIYFWDSLKQKKRIIDIVIIILCIITGLISGGRFGMASYLISVIIMYHLIHIKKLGYYKKYKITTVIKMTIIVIIAFCIFYVVRTLVGRDDEQDILGYIGHYFGGGVPLFDIFLKQNNMKPIIWGEETFYSLINNFRRLGIVDIQYYMRHHEFVYRYGNSMGNVYTAFRDYYHDFGLLGLYILHSIFSIIYSCLYNKMKKNGELILIIIFSTIYYAIVFYPFNNSFFASTISIGYLLQMTILVICFEIFIRKRIVLK